MPKKEV